MSDKIIYVCRLKRGSDWNKIPKKITRFLRVVLEKVMTNWTESENI